MVKNGESLSAHTNHRIKGSGLALLAATLWGVSGTFGQFLFQLKDVDAGWLVTIRLLIAGLLMLVFACLRAPQDFTRIWKNKTDATKLLAFGIVGMLAVQYTYFAAIRESNAATATVLQYLGPVMIAIWYAATQARLPNLTEFSALLFAVTGTFILVTHGSIETLSITPLALFWGVASAAALAYYSIQPVKLLQRYDSAVVVGWGMMIGGVALSFIHPPWHASGVWDLSTYGFAAFVILGGSLIAFYAYLSAVKRIGAQRTSVLACFEPLSAAALSVAWLGVNFGVFDWLGTALILSAVLLLT